VTGEQTAQVLAKARCYDPTVDRPDPGTLMAWAEALANLRVEDCLAAVGMHYRAHTRRIMPADVRELVRSIGNDRAMAALPPPSKPDPAGQARMAEMCRAAFRDAKGLAPEPHAAQRRAALLVSCPWEACRARPGRPCEVDGRPAQWLHPSRYDAALSQAKAGKESA
jgi:hypothetical protein